MQIEIKNIEGLFTNADQGDINDNFATTLQNLKPLNGKLEKTFGFGDFFSLDVLDIIETGYWVDSGKFWDDGQWWLDSGESLTKSIGASIINLVTYFNQNAYGGSGNGSGDGYVIIGVAINATTNVVTFYYWTGTLWENITNLVENTPDTFYHLYDKNPIVQQNEIIRFLPGKDGTVGTSNSDAIGAWLGYIDRNLFDDEVLASIDYNSGFYLLPITPETPDLNGLSYAITELDGSDMFTSSDTPYYKLSYVYDGVVESLLSQEKQHIVTGNKYLKHDFSITLSTMNKRVTAINVYRSDNGNNAEASENVDGTFLKIHTIDFTRTQEDISYLSPGTAYTGHRKVHIPNIDTTTSVSVLATNWELTVDGTAYSIETPASGILSESMPTYFTLLNSEPDISGDKWNVSWSLTYSEASITKTWDSDTDGCYAGNKAIIYPAAGFTIGSLVGALFRLTSGGSWGAISENQPKAIYLGTAQSKTTSTDSSILRVIDGLYFFSNSSGTISITFFDTKLTQGSAYSLLNSPSIEVNAEHSVVHAGRLFQGNIALDPHNDNETHPDWVNYSELDQYDVNPVSNVIKISDSTGSEITGLATSFGSIIILKKNSIHKLNLVTPATPSSWVLSESVFNRGNVAKKGYIQVGHIVYFCSTDGIYELDVNFQAAADDTPLIQNRISEPINNTYLALNDISEKPYITCGYDKINTEIIFRLTSTSIWAFNILEKVWREIDTAKTCDIFAYDQNDNLIIFNESNDQLYSIDESESVGCKVITKVFDISKDNGNRKGLVRYVTIKYKSAVALSIKLYCDDASTAKLTKSLAISSVITEKRLTFKYYCKTFKVEISDSTSTTNDTEIYNIKINVE